MCPSCSAHNFRGKAACYRCSSERWVCNLSTYGVSFHSKTPLYDSHDTLEFLGNTDSFELDVTRLRLTGLDSDLVLLSHGATWLTAADMPNDDGLNVTYTFWMNMDSCLESLEAKLVLIAQASRSIWQRSARAVPKHSSKSIWSTNTKSRFVINFPRNPLNVFVTLTNGMLIKADTFAACESQIEICMEFVVFRFVKHGCAGDWTCAECGGSNFARRNTCFKCEAPRYIFWAPTPTWAIFSALYLWFLWRIKRCTF